MKNYQKTSANRLTKAVDKASGNKIDQKRREWKRITN